MGFTDSSFFKHCCKIAFKKVDKDGTGEISKDELKYAMCIFCYKMSKKIPGYMEPPTSEEIEETFKEFDKDGSSSLTEDEYEEFVRFWCKKNGKGFTGALIAGLTVSFIVIPKIANEVGEMPVFKKIPRVLIMGVCGIVSKYIFMKVFK